MRTIEIFKLYGSILVNTDEAMKSISSVGKNMEDTGKKIEKFGKDLTKKVTAPVMAIGGAAIKVGMDFEQSMSKVKAMSGATDEQMKKLEKAARDAGATTSKSAKESADALSYMALAGWDVESSIEGLMPVLKLSEAGNIDLAKASSLVTDSMSAMGIEVQDLDKYLDIVAQTARSSNTDIDQMAEAYLGVGGTLRGLGIPLEESALALGMLANAGIKGSEAGTSLNAILLNLTAPTGRAKKAFEELGYSAFDSQGNFKGLETVLFELKDEFADMDTEQRNMYLSMIGGKEHIDGLNALLNGLEDSYDDLTQAISESDGALNEVRDTMMDNAKGALTNLKSALEELGLKIYEIVAPSFEKLIEGIQGVVNWLNDLSPEMQETIVKVAGVAAAIGPLIMVGGKLTAGIGKVIGLASKVGAILSPQGLILVGIGLLITWIVHLWQTNEEFRARIAEIWEQVQDIFSSTFEIIQGIIGVFVVWATEFWNIFGENIIGITDTAWKFITSVISVALDLIKSIISIFIGIVTGDWGKFAEGLKGLWKAAWSAIKAILEIAKLLIEDIFYIFIKTISETWQNFTELLKNIWDAAWGIIRNVTDVILNAIKNIIDIFISAVTGAWTAFTDLLKNIWQNMWDGIKRIVEGAWELLSSAFAMLWDSIENWFIELAKAAMTWGIDMVKGLWEGISSMVDWIGEKVSGFAAGVANSFKKFFGIASPSTLMAEYGKNIDEGLAEGILEHQNIPLAAIEAIGIKLSDAAKKTVSTVNRTFSKASSSGGGGGSSGSKSSSREREEYQRENREYERENRSEIKRISDDHGVDMGVAREMAKTNEREGKKIYHDGGWVGRPLFNMESLLNNVQAWLKNDELAAILQDGEFVLSRDMLGQIKKASDSIGAASKSGGNGGKGGDIIQHIKIVSPEPLSPSETARQVKNASRELAMEV